MPRVDRRSNARGIQNSRFAAAHAASRGNVRDELVVVAGFEDNTNSPGKTRAALPCGADSGAVSDGFATLTAEDRARMAAVFDSLPERLRSAIMDAAWGTLADRYKAEIVRLVDMRRI
jgi:hypothetical protein